MTEEAPAKEETEKASAIYDGLAQLGIAHIVATYSGCGDSGCVEEIEAFAPNNTRVVLSAEHTLTIPRSASQWNPNTRTYEHGPETLCTLSASEVLEYWCYEILEEHHGGWEIDDGADGKLAIDVAARTALLTHNSHFRCTDTTETEI